MGTWKHRLTLKEKDETSLFKVFSLFSVSGDDNVKISIFEIYPSLRDTIFSLSRLIVEMDFIERQTLSYLGGDKIKSLNSFRSVFRSSSIRKHCGLSEKLSSLLISACVTDHYQSTCGSYN